MSAEFEPDVKMVLVFFFLNACLNLGPVMGIHESLATLLISSLLSLLVTGGFYSSFK